MIKDIVKTIVVVVICGIVVGYFLGLRTGYSAGVTYTTDVWDWRFGVPAAFIPVIFSKKLYSWFRSRGNGYK